MRGPEPIGHCQEIDHDCDRDRVTVTDYLIGFSTVLILICTAHHGHGHGHGISSSFNDPLGYVAEINTP